MARSPTHTTAPLGDPVQRCSAVQACRASGMQRCSGVPPERGGGGTRPPAAGSGNQSRKRGVIAGALGACSALAICRHSELAGGPAAATRRAALAGAAARPPPLPSGPAAQAQSQIENQ